MRWCTSFVIGIIAVLTGCSGAQVAEPDPSTSTAAETGAASSCDAPVHDGASAGAASVQDILDDAAAAENGGVVAAIASRGVVRYCAAGRATTTRTLLAPDYVFRIASITKTFTAVIVMQLVEERQLSLDTRVGDVLPDLDLAEAVTVRQLLSHTSGLPDFFDDTFRNRAFEDWDRTWTPTEVLDRLIETGAPPVQTADEVPSYASTNYLIAGLLIEEVTGRTLAENLRTRIIEPLGLASTALAPEGPEPVTGFAAHLPFGNSESVSYTSLATGIWAAGAMVSTAPDLMTFAQALPDGELVSAESWDLMTDFLQMEDGIGMGLGVGRDDIDGRTVIGHDGLLPGYTSSFVLLPDSDEVVVVLTNDVNIAAYDVVEALVAAP